MRRIVKLCAEVVCLLLVTPLLLPVRLEGAFSRSEALFVFCGNLLSLLPGAPGVLLRRGYYSQALRSCGRSLTVEFGSFFSRRNASVGHNVYIGAYSILGTVAVGDDVLIASRVSIPSGRHQHAPRAVERYQANRYDAVQVGSGSWVGEGAVVLAGVGRDCIVGAGSVVVKPVPDGAVVAGNPAAQLRKRGTADAAVAGEAA